MSEEPKREILDDTNPVFTEYREMHNGEEYGLDEEFEVRSCYTKDGKYIGDRKTTDYLVGEVGIVPELRADGSSVCSVGFSEKDGKWYGWSHRAIHGFKTGDKLSKSHTKKGEWGASLGAGYEIQDADDAKRVAALFAEGVS